jgi:predicted transcriptional regulator
MSKARHFYKNEAECPENLLASRTSDDPIVKISGALCEAIQRNQQWIVEPALRAMTALECRQLLAIKQLEEAQSD